MKNKLLSFLLGLFIFPITLLAQSYLWPTNASEFLSSSFCEFREGHYHSAIDIKTWNTEGYPCYAVEDGYVKRVRVSPFGYGKVMYIQLKDGNTAVYAHLQKFGDQIDAQVRAMQFQNKKYSVNWWPTNLKVKKGDIIAYTGRTGIGVPHLHFEIRNKKDNPVNPHKFYTQIKDQIRPRLQELAVIPLSDGTKINGSYLPQRFTLTHIKNGIYVIKKAIYVDGRVGLAIRGFDQADDVHNKYGFYKSKLEVDGNKIFELVYDELEFKTTEHINTEIYYQWWSELRDRFNKLFIESFNPLPFYDRTLDSDGSLHIDDKPLAFKITISDYNDNQSLISSELLAAKQATIKINYAGKKGNLAYLDFNAPPISDLSFDIQNKKGHWKAAEYFEIPDGFNRDRKQNIRTQITLHDSTDQKIKIRLNKNIEQTISLAPAVLPETISYVVHSPGKNLIVQIPDVDSRPFATLEPQNIPLDYTQTAGQGMEILIPARMISGIRSTLTLSGEKNTVSLPPLEYYQLLPGEKHQVACFDSAVVIGVSEGSLMDTVLISANRLATDSVLSGYTLASKIYEVGPDNFPLFQSLLIRIKADSLPGWGKWSLYKTNGRDRLSYLSVTVDTLRMELTARTSSLGKFVVASDTTAPHIYISNPQSGQRYKSTPAIRLDIRDEISGIGDEENISILMNGEFVLPEWDPEEDILKGVLREDLKSGEHLLEVKVRDRAGNMAGKSIVFNID